MHRCKNVYGSYVLKRRYENEPNHQPNSLPFETSDSNFAAAGGRIQECITPQQIRVSNARRTDIETEGPVERWNDADGAGHARWAHRVQYRNTKIWTSGRCELPHTPARIRKAGSDPDSDWPTLGRTPRTPGSEQWRTCIMVRECAVRRRDLTYQRPASTGHPASLYTNPAGCPVRSEVGIAMDTEVDDDPDTRRKYSLAVCKLREGIRRGGIICEVYLEPGMMRARGSAHRRFAAVGVEKRRTAD